MGTGVRRPEDGHNANGVLVAHADRFVDVQRRFRCENRNKPTRCKDSQYIVLPTKRESLAFFLLGATVVSIQYRNPIVLYPGRRFAC